MSDYVHHEMFPLGEDKTPYRLLTTDFVSTVNFDGREMLKVDSRAFSLLADQALRDTSHLLRPGHLAQLKKIIDDPEASDNDRFVAVELLKNANIAAGGVLPMCQDTGTAIVMGKKGQDVLTDGTDEAALSRVSSRHIPSATCATARWRRSTCSTSPIPATICRPRSTCIPRPATPTSSCSWPRAAARRTRPISIRRPRRC